MIDKDTGKKVPLTLEEKKKIVQSRLDTSAWKGWKLRLFQHDVCLCASQLSECELIVVNGVDGLMIKAAPSPINASGHADMARLFDEEDSQLLKVKVVGSGDITTEPHWALNPTNRLTLGDWLALGNLSYPLDRIFIPPAWLGME